MKAFAFNTDVMKSKKPIDEKPKLKEFNQSHKQKQKSKNKQQFEDMRKKILKDLTVNKSIKKKSSSRQRVKTQGGPAKANPPLQLLKGGLFQ